MSAVLSLTPAERMNSREWDAAVAVKGALTTVLNWGVRVMSWTGTTVVPPRSTWSRATAPAIPRSFSRYCTM